MAVYFVSGIDTDAGKTIATGAFARSLMDKGINVITQKLIQTGCVGVAEDIVRHRELMDMDLLDIDKNGTTCTTVMTYPASPHLAAEIDKVNINIPAIGEATKKLESLYDVVLLEGAGGLYVPITREYLTIDYIQDNSYPLILVTSSKLGSINHTLMSLELCRLRGIELAYVIYNHFPNNSQIITDDTIRVIRDYLKANFPATELLELPVVEDDRQIKLV